MSVARSGPQVIILLGSKSDREHRAAIARGLDRYGVTHETRIASAHRVTRNDVEVHLGPTEFRLLDYFIQHPGRVFSREQLLDAVWGSDVYVETRTVDVHIGRLRKALSKGGGEDPIRTVRSAGYALNAGYGVTTGSGAGSDDSTLTVGKRAESEIAPGPNAIT